VGKETWVRPPVVAAEPRSTRAAVWRYRAVSFVLLVLLAVLTAWLFLKFSNVTGGEDPGIGLSRPHHPVAAGR
jgi:hypothetical protein